jgi:hypothetical protein
MPPTLDWSLTQSPDGTRLRVELAVTNATAERIYVADKLLAPSGGTNLHRVHALIVMNEGEPGEPVPGVAKLVLGMVAADSDLAVLYPAAVRPLDAGERHEASYELAFPLEAWHPQGLAAPIDDGVTAVNLYVQVTIGEPIEWRELGTDESTPLRVPWLARRGQLLSTGPKPLPCR